MLAPSLIASGKAAHLHSLVRGAQASPKVIQATLLCLTLQRRSISISERGAGQLGWFRQPGQRP
jgi:hypothetical protein